MQSATIADQSSCPQPSAPDHPADAARLANELQRKREHERAKRQAETSEASPDGFRKTTSFPGGSRRLAFDDGFGNQRNDGSEWPQYGRSTNHTVRLVN